MASGGRNTILTVSAGILLLAFVILVLFVVFQGTGGNGGPSPANATNATPAAGAGPTVENISKIGEFNVDSGDYIDSDGLTASQKIDAINLTIASALMNQSFAGYTGTELQYSKTVGQVVSLDDRAKVETMRGTDGGYIDWNTSMLAVPVQFSLLPSYFEVIFYVDLAGNRVLGYDEVMSKVGRMGYAIIPPGKSWYFKLVRSPNMTDNNLSDLLLRIYWNTSYSDTLYPIIMNEDSFRLYKNGSTPSPEEFISGTTGEKLTLDGSTPIHPQRIDNGTAWWLDTIVINRSIPAGT